MADSDSGEKTEDPTSKRLDESRKKGQIARSRELATALVLVGSAVALLMMGKSIANALASVMTRMFTLSRDETYDFTHMFQAWGFAISEVSTPLLLFLVIVTVAGFIGSIATGGYNFSWEAITPKGNKLSPIQGFKRMFGINGLVELLKAIAKFIVVGTATYFALDFFRDETLHLDIEAYPLNLFHGLDIIGWIFLIMCCALIPVAAFDVPYQIFKHDKELKMTKQEVKDERKNSEGDPQVKGRIRKLQYQAAANRMMQDVPKADVIVTNPTHFSVALKYDENGSTAPVVLAKGVDELAFHIRKIADAHDVPLVESPMLARAIYHTTEVQHPIPEKLFMAVAQVLAYVYQLKKFKSGKGQRPKALQKNLPIPPDMQY